MREINTAFKSFLNNKLDIIDLLILVRKRINELKKCHKDCQFQKELKNLNVKSKQGKPTRNNRNSRKTNKRTNVA